MFILTWDAPLTSKHLRRNLAPLLASVCLGLDPGGFDVLGIDGWWVKHPGCLGFRGDDYIAHL